MAMGGWGDGNRVICGGGLGGSGTRASGGETGGEGVDGGCDEKNLRRGSMFGSGCAHGCDAAGGGNVAW